MRSEKEQDKTNKSGKDKKDVQAKGPENKSKAGNAPPNKNLNKSDASKSKGKSAEIKPGKKASKESCV